MPLLLKCRLKNSSGSQIWLGYRPVSEDFAIKALAYGSLPAKLFPWAKQEQLLTGEALTATEFTRQFRDAFGRTSAAKDAQDLQRSLDPILKAIVVVHRPRSQGELDECEVKLYWRKTLKDHLIHCDRLGNPKPLHFTAT